MKTSPEHSVESVKPVIFAGSSNLDNWPLSRVKDPIQFQRNKREQSSFQIALLCATSLPNAKSPLVFVSANHLKTARKQADQIGLLDSCQFIVEPIERGNWQAVIFASALIARSAPDDLMILIDSVHTIKNIGAFASAFQQVRQHMPEKGMVVFGLAYDPEKHQRMKLTRRKGCSIVNSLLQVAPHHNHGDNTGAEAYSIYSIGPAFMVSPKQLLDMAKAINPEEFHSVNMALQHANSMNDALWADLNMWATLEMRHIGDELHKLTDQFLLRPTDFIVSKKQKESSSHFLHNNTNCNLRGDGHLIAMIGCKNLEVTTTKDATLIQPKNLAVNVDELITQMRDAQCPELYHSSIVQHPWGTETLIDQNHKSQVFKIELQPGSSIPEHFHAHRAENWQVLSGLGTATISGVEHQITTGWTYSIDKNTLHGCTSSNTTPLVFMETRIGDFLHEDDIVHTKVKQRPAYSAGTKASSPP